MYLYIYIYNLQQISSNYQCANLTSFKDNKGGSNAQNAAYAHNTPLHPLVFRYENSQKPKKKKKRKI
jgi:hypothetical protein